MEKKKRGRKPKKKKEENETEPMKEEANLVIRLSPTDKVTNENISDIMGNQEVCNNSICGKQNTGEVCWNCCHTFQDLIYGIPLKYHDKIFYTYGDFCSFECCARYAYEYFPSCYFDILSLIHLHNKEIFGGFSQIQMAPSKLNLQMFGGDLTIDEYRVKKEVHEINLPPIFPVNHSKTTYETKTLNHANNLKLYRKKKLPSENKSIANTMKLTVLSS